MVSGLAMGNAARSPPGHLTRRCCTARVAASVRLLASSFDRMLLTWFDGRAADRQPLRDPAVVQTLDHQREHFHFALGQVMAERRRLRRRFDQRAGGFRRGVDLP